MADEEELSQDDFQEEKSKKASGAKNPLLTLLVLINTGLMGFVAYMQWGIHEKQSKTADIKDIVRTAMEEELGTQDEIPGAAKEEDGILFPLDSFTANLAQGDGPRRYVRLNPVLKFKKQSSEQEFKARKPQIRDAIISILNSKRPTDLLKSEGKDFLKEEIKAAINAFLVDGHVIDVYYVGFQIN